MVPSREGLLGELVTRGVMRMARPSVVALAALLEDEFTPLGLVAAAVPVLDALRTEGGPTVLVAGTLGGGSASNSLKQYVPNLERLIVFRLLQQLSRVYSTLSLSVFRSLLTGLTLPFHDIEKLVARSVKNRQLQVRIDPRGGLMRFGGALELEASDVRKQLIDLAGKLHGVMAVVAPGNLSVERFKRREGVFAAARATLPSAPREAKKRKDEIERRKEIAERSRQIQEREVRVSGGARRPYIPSSLPPPPHPLTPPPHPAGPGAPHP